MQLHQNQQPISVINIVGSQIMEWHNKYAGGLAAQIIALLW